MIQWNSKIHDTKMTVLWATTKCKNVETLPRKSDLSCFKSLLVIGLWDMILPSLLPPIQSFSSKFWVWSCIASNFDKGWRGDHKHKIMDRPFMPKYGTVSKVLLQLVVGTELLLIYIWQVLMLKFVFAPKSYRVFRETDPRPECLWRRHKKLPGRV